MLDRYEVVACAFCKALALFVCLLVWSGARFRNVATFCQLPSFPTYKIVPWRLALLPRRSRDSEKRERVEVVLRFSLDILMYTECLPAGVPQVINFEMSLSEGGVINYTVACCKLVGRKYLQSDESGFGNGIPGGNRHGNRQGAYPAPAVSPSPGPSPRCTVNKWVKIYV